MPRLAVGVGGRRGSRKCAGHPCNQEARYEQRRLLVVLLKSLLAPADGLAIGDRDAVDAVDWAIGHEGDPCVEEVEAR